MISEIIITCARKDCTARFEKKKHNQKYCSSECCRIATNANIMAKYYENQARLAGVVRHCAGCSAKLSKYNPDVVCSKCEAPQRSSDAERVRQYLVGAV